MIKQTKLFFTCLLMGLVLLQSGCKNSQEKPTLTSMMIHYKTNIQGYLVHPTHQKKAPGLLLIHEWWGLNDNIKEFANQFAAEGYTVLAVDLYQGQSTSDPAKARTLATQVRNNPDKAFSNLKTALSFLKEYPTVIPSKMASVGWCFGGGWSYQIAKNNLGVRASVIYYGPFNPKDDLTKMKATLQGHFAEKDMHIKVNKVHEFQANLKTLKGNHTIYIYPNTQHGFANKTNPIYSKEASDKAWHRTLRFLNKILK